MSVDGEKQQSGGGGAAPGAGNDPAAAGPPGAGPADERAPLPDEASQRKAMELVREVYADEYARDEAEDRLALSAHLIDQVDVGTDDAASRFVMLTEARDLAASAGDVVTAFGAVDRLALSFVGVDPIAMKLDVLAWASKPAPGMGKAADAARAAALVDGHITVAGELAGAAELGRAVEVLAEAEPIARKSGDEDLVARLHERKRHLKALVAEFGSAVGPARAALAADPGDEAANLAMGRFYCLAVGDWDRGLSLLAKGNDPAFRKLAGDDLAGADGRAAAMVTLGDQWWEFGEKQPATVRDRVRRRAAHWYRQALDELVGLQRKRLEKRLAPVGPSDPPAGKPRDPAEGATRFLKGLVAKLPAKARPRKGQPWDPAEATERATAAAAGAKFDAVLHVGHVNATRFDGRDSYTVVFDRVGPVTQDGVPYRLAVILLIEGGVPADMMRKVKPGVHVRVRGDVTAVTAGSSSAGRVVTEVALHVRLDRPNLTVVASPARAAKPPPADSGQRLLEKLARTMPKELRPRPAEQWTGEGLTAWLREQTPDAPVEVTALVSAVHAHGEGANNTLSVVFDPVGPVTVDEVDYVFQLVLHANAARSGTAWAS